MLSGLLGLQPLETAKNGSLRVSRYRGLEQRKVDRFLPGLPLEWGGWKVSRYPTLAPESPHRASMPLQAAPDFGLAQDGAVSAVRLSATRNSPTTGFPYSLKRPGVERAVSSSQSRAEAKPSGSVTAGSYSISKVRWARRDTGQKVRTRDLSVAAACLGVAGLRTRDRQEGYRRRRLCARPTP